VTVKVYFVQFSQRIYKKNIIFLIIQRDYW